MSGKFSPLVLPTPAAESSGFKAAKVLPRPESAPLGGVCGGEVVAGTSGPSQPTVTLRREGNVIKGLRIECVCGQVIELDCVFEG